MLATNSYENLKIMNNCPVCKAKYNPLEAKIIDEKENVHLMHVKCKKCQSSVLVLVYINNVGINSIGLITDLEMNEVMDYCYQESISSNDVLTMYQALKKEINIFKILKNNYGKTRVTCKTEKGEG